MESPRHLEGIADEVHAELGLEPPIDAFVLAEALGLTVRAWGRSGGSLTGDEIRYPGKARATRQHGVIAHETGHWLLWRAGVNMRDERGARYLAGALMLPRRRFLADLARTEWDLFRMLEIHANASAEMVACRMCQVSPTVAVIYDQGHETCRYVGEHMPEVDAVDQEIADRALESEAVVRDARAVAYPFLEGQFRRVVVVRRAA
jgi:hypothetical protein